MSANDDSPWTPEEDYDLTVAYRAGGDELAARFLAGRRSPAEVCLRALELGLERGRPWDMESLLLLLRLENVPGALEEFAYEHGRTLRAVTERYRRLHRATKAPRTTNPRGKLKLSDARLLAFIRAEDAAVLEEEELPWTPDDEHFLVAAYRAGGDDLAVRYFEGRRPPVLVVRRAIELGLERGRPWDVEALLLLLQTRGDKASLKQLAKAQGRAVQSVVARYKRLHEVPKASRKLAPRGKVEPWTQEELAWLRRHYATSTAEELVARFPHRTLSSIRIRASEMGLTLSRSKATRLARERAALGSAGPRADAGAI